MRSNLSSRLKEKRRKTVFLRGAVFLGVFVALVGVIALLSGAKFITIHGVRVEGNQAVEAEDVISFTENKLRGRYFNLFSRANTLLYPKGAIQKELLGTFARFKEVSIERETWHDLKITVEERKPEALWCAVASSTACSFLDENGLVFAEAPEYSGNVYIKFGGVLSDTSSTRQYLSPEEFRAARSFLHDLDSLDLKGRYFDKEESGDVHLELEDGSEILWGKDQTYGAVLEKLRAGLSEIKNAAKKEGKSLKSIDLRFGNQIVYRFRE